MIKDKKIFKIDEDVVSFRLSPSGKGLAYAVYDNDCYTLELYSVRSKKSVTVSDEMCGLNFAISPDGKSVVYTVEDDGKVEIMYAKGTRSQAVTTDAEEILGLSNNSKQIYLISENDDGDTVLYSYNKKGQRKNLGDIDSEYVRFNADHTQIMFYNNGKTYISNKGKDDEKIVSDSIRLVLAPNSQSISCSGNYDYTTTYPVSSLYDHVYSGDDAWLIRKNANKNVKLASDVSSCSLDKSARYLYFVHDYDELMVLKIAKGNKAYSKAVTLADDIANYVVTSDRKLVYFISDKALYSVNGRKGGTVRKIANDDVEHYYLALNGKDTVYYIMDGDTYACSNGRKGMRIVSDSVVLAGTPNGVVYIRTVDYIYATTGSKKLKKITKIGLCSCAPDL